MALSIRNAEPADVPRVVDLLAAQLGDHSLRPPTDTLTAGVAALVGSDQLGRIIVAERDGVMVGVAAISWTFSLEHGGRSAWLDELYVMPAERGHGTGTALVHACLERAAAAGAVAIDLEVEVGHERAEGLYAREGFRAHRRNRWWRRL